MLQLGETHQVLWKSNNGPEISYLTTNNIVLPLHEDDGLRWWGTSESDLQILQNLVNIYNPSIFFFVCFS